MKTEKNHQCTHCKGELYYLKNHPLDMIVCAECNMYEPLMPEQRNLLGSLVDNFFMRPSFTISEKIWQSIFGDSTIHNKR